MPNDYNLTTHYLFNELHSKLNLSLCHVMIRWRQQCLSLYIIISKSYHKWATYLSEYRIRTFIRLFSKAMFHYSLLNLFSEEDLMRKQKKFAFNFQYDMTRGGFDWDSSRLQSGGSEASGLKPQTKWDLSSVAFFGCFIRGYSMLQSIFSTSPLGPQYIIAHYLSPSPFLFF